jgi:ribonuclease VapC
MLVVDSSAIIAMLFEEPEGPACISALKASASRMISAANYVETGTVLAGRAAPGQRRNAIADLDAFLSMLGIEIAPLDAALARTALEARIRFGKGFGNRKGLNFGDSFAYALASSLSAPLLFVGDDFYLTDITPALT